MPVDFEITLIDPKPAFANEPKGKWIAANTEPGGYHLRFEHPKTWTLKSFKAFQVLPNGPNSAAAGVGVAIQTKREIMVDHWLNGGVNALYDNWKDPGVLYFRPGHPTDATFKKITSTKAPKKPAKNKMLTIHNRANRGLQKRPIPRPRDPAAGLEPVYDIILHFLVPKAVLTAAGNPKLVGGNPVAAIDPVTGKPFTAPLVNAAGDAVTVDVLVDPPFRNQQ